MSKLLALSILLIVSSYVQSQTYISDSIMKVIVDKGIADKKFKPKGKKNKEDQKIETWVEYEFEFYDTYEQIVVKENDLVKTARKHLLVELTGEYINDKKEGLWTICAIEANSFKRFKIMTVNYKNNKREGQCLLFFSSGERAGEGTYANNYLQGKFTVYYKTQEIASTYEYLYDKIQGKAESFYRTGELKGIYNYKNHLQEGEETTYFRDRTLKSKTFYVKDTLHSDSRNYYQNGKIKEEALYDHGKLVDLRYFYQSGQLWVHRTYKDGKEYNVIELFNSSGEPMDFGTIKDGNGTIKYYTTEGELYQISTFENGNKIKEEEFGDWK